MQTRKFGRTEMQTTPVGLGSWAAGWGAEDDEEAFGHSKGCAENFRDDDWRSRAAFKEPQLSCNLKLVGPLCELGGLHGAAPGEVAISWTPRYPALTVAIVGAHRPDQVERIPGSANLVLDDAEVGDDRVFPRTGLLNSRRDA